MGKGFFAIWAVLVLALAGVVSCSDSHNGGSNGAAAGSDGDRDSDGVPDAKDDDIDGDGVTNTDDTDDDGDGIPDSEEDGSDAGGGGGGGGGNIPHPLGGPLPTFPGSGTSDAGDPLPNGMLCDSVPGEDLPIAGGGIATCFLDPADGQVAATLEQVLECVEGTDTVHVRLTLHPWFVDNTYGANAIGWAARIAAKGGKGKGGHSFDDLVGSDHAEIILKDDAGNVVLQFKLDYLTADPNSPSGFSSLGVTGGEGDVLVGDAASVVKWSTSIDRNLNERGYGDYIVDSPATDADFTANADAPEWDFRVVYEAWIDVDIFSQGGFGGATIEYVHASPAKSATNTIEVVPGKCPPPPPSDCLDGDPDADCGSAGSGGGGGDQPPGCIDNDPDTFCGEGGVGGSGTGGMGGSGGAPPDSCVDNNPDTFCDEGGTGGSGTGGGDTQYCIDHPDDPACHVE